MADLLKNTVISLKQSLVYTLSLGDKELFHSNVLGWLLENHNDKGIQPIVKLFINDELEIERNILEKSNSIDEKSGAIKINLMHSGAETGKCWVTALSDNQHFPNLLPEEQLNFYWTFIN